MRHVLTFSAGGLDGTERERLASDATRQYSHSFSQLAGDPGGEGEDIHALEIRGVRRRRGSNGSFDLSWLTKEPDSPRSKFREGFTNLPSDDDAKIIAGLKHARSSAHAHTRHGAGMLERLYTDFVAGMLSFALSTVIYVSLGTTVIGPVDPHFIFVGIGMCVLPAAVIGWTLTLFSSLPWTMPSTDVTFIPILAEMGQTVSSVLTQAGHTEDIIPTFVASICITFVLVGLALSVMGTIGISSLANYLPAQVVAGFLAGTGFQLLLSATRMAAAVPAVLDVGSYRVPMFLCGCALAAVLRWAHSLRTVKVAFTVPIALVLATIIFHAAWWFSGHTFDDAIAQGWLFDWSHEVVRDTPRFWTMIMFGGPIGWTRRVWWAAIEQCLPYMGSAITIGVLKLSIKAGTFSVMFHREINADLELIKLGLVNILCGCIGAIGLHWSFSNTNLGHELGASNTGGGIVYAACFAVLWYFGIGPLQRIPIFVYAALLADVGFTFLVDYLLRPFQIYDGCDKAVLVVVVATFVGCGMIQGIALGVLVTLVLLVIRLHHFGTVRMEMDGLNARSSVERDKESEHILSTYGASTHIMRLQGYLFFATGNDIVAHAKERLLSNDCAVPLLCLVLDLSLVSAMDVTAVKHFVRLGEIADGTLPIMAGHEANHAHFHVALCGLHPSVMDVMRPHCSCDRFKFFDDIDDALEFAEDECIRSRGGSYFSRRSRAKSAPPSDVLKLWDIYLGHFMADQEGARTSHMVTTDPLPPVPAPITPQPAGLPSCDREWEDTAKPRRSEPPAVVTYDDANALTIELCDDTLLPPASTSAAVPPTAPSRALESHPQRHRELASAFGNAPALPTSTTTATTPGSRGSSRLQEPPNLSRRLLFPPRSLPVVPAPSTAARRQFMKTHLGVIGLHLTNINLPDGQVLFEQNTALTAMFFVVFGNIDLTQTITGEAVTCTRRSDVRKQHKAVKRIRKVGPGCIIAASEMHIDRGFSDYTATAVSPCVVLKLRYATIRELENSAPNSAVCLHRLIGYFLARKNDQSKKQIQQLSILGS